MNGVEKCLNVIRVDKEDFALGNVRPLLDADNPNHIPTAKNAEEKYFGIVNNAEKKCILLRAGFRILVLRNVLIFIGLKK